MSSDPTASRPVDPEQLSARLQALASTRRGLLASAPLAALVAMLAGPASAAPRPRPRRSGAVLTIPVLNYEIRVEDAMDGTVLLDVSRDGGLIHSASHAGELTPDAIAKIEAVAALDFHPRVVRRFNFLLVSLGLGELALFPGDGSVDGAGYGGAFVLILVLFILLVIVGAGFGYE